MKTSVVNVRGKDRAELMADPDFVYVGRACRGWPASPFGNPFHLRHPARRERTPTEVVAMYAYWIESCEPGDSDTPKAMARRRAEILRLLPSLRGKKLGCWCCDWQRGEPRKPCHAVILAQMADSGIAEAKVSRRGTGVGS